MDRQTPQVGDIDFVRWFVRVLTWDGALPVCLFLIPLVAKLMVPNQGGMFVFLAVVLPIIALFIRLPVGCRHIDDNTCGPLFQKLQVWMLLIGALILVIVDALLVIAHEIGWRVMFAARQDLVILATLASIYLTCMVIAMYPGRSKPLPDVFRPMA